MTRSACREQVSKGDGDDPLYVVECDLAGRTMNIVNPAGETCIYIQKRWAPCSLRSCRWHALPLEQYASVFLGPLNCGSTRSIGWHLIMQGLHTPSGHRKICCPCVHPESSSLRATLRGSALSQKSLPEVTPAFATKALERVSSILDPHPRLSGLTLTLTVHLAADIDRSVKTMLLNAALGAGSELIIDVAAGVDWTAAIAVVYGIQQARQGHSTTLSAGCCHCRAHDNTCWLPAISGPCSLLALCWPTPVVCQIPLLVAAVLIALQVVRRPTWMTSLANPRFVLPDRLGSPSMPGRH